MCSKEATGSKRRMEKDARIMMRATSATTTMCSVYMDIEENMDYNVQIEESMDHG